MVLTKIYNNLKHMNFVIFNYLTLTIDIQIFIYVNNVEEVKDTVFKEKLLEKNVLFI